MRGLDITPCIEKNNNSYDFVFAERRSKNIRFRYYASLTITFILIIILFIKHFLLELGNNGCYNHFNVASDPLVINDFNNQNLIDLKLIKPYSISEKEFNDWTVEQFEISKEKILQNINFNGNLNFNKSIPLGIIIASPSNSNPNYYFQWTRDNAIIINSLIDEFYQSNDSSIKDIILQYFNNSIILQRLNNLSGNFTLKNKFKNLAEPKFNINNTPFNENWGRPQNDGPPLRVIASINFLNKLFLQTNDCKLIDLLNDNYNFDNDFDLIEKMLYWDLKFIILNWNEKSFDPWEEIVDQHFFTNLIQFYAIEQAIIFLQNYQKTYNFIPHNDTNLIHDLKITSNKLLKFLLSENNFLNSNKSYIIESPNLLNIRSGLDIAVILASIITHPTKNTIPFDVTDSGILNTLYELIHQMSILYPINHQYHKLNTGVALGRYTEDVYDGVGFVGGNPWFIATISASNLILKLIEHFHLEKKDLIFNLKDNQFWNLIFNIKCSCHINHQILIPYNSLAYNMTVHQLFNFSDSFLEIVRTHVSDEGEMSEQFNKYTGFLQGARDLSWSYSSFLDVSKIRNRIKDHIQ